MFGRIPNVNKVLGIEKPSFDDYLGKSEFDSESFASTHNKAAREKQINPDKIAKRLVIGSNVHYKKYSTKDSRPIKASVLRIDGEHVVLKNLEGRVVTRHYSDVLC